MKNFEMKKSSIEFTTQFLNILESFVCGICLQTKLCIKIFVVNILYVSDTLKNRTFLQKKIILNFYLKVFFFVFIKYSTIS